MKTICSFLILLMTLISYIPSAICKDNIPQRMELYKDTRYPFSISFPSDWLVVEGKNRFVTVNALSENGIGDHGVTIRVEKNNEKSNNILDIMNSDDLLEDDFERIDSGIANIKETTAIWCKSVRYSSTAAYSSSGKVICSITLQYAIAKNNYIYFLTGFVGGIGKEKTFEKFKNTEKELLDIILGFNIEK